ncbi:conserved hypothetical protein [Desulfamplus magnetovallimortis]|uniref:BrnA antitoxin family protein n=1 Tax=Desulfamplus magnetovallimortis TaxID=1246637 RepID=A0A1W1H541_9BACT|nr:BrnA antitoxin family protein [Desulfamplus magnetovallimortis]SLM27562.1 conserved hypothetical protein [Desulfamplus magnetovallimortis]
MSRQPLIDNDGEVRELTSEDFKNMRPVSEVLPKELLDALPKRGRIPKTNPKKQLTIRLNSEIVDFFKARGKGWQTEINNILQEYVNSK